jgi:hypothetical protein
MLINRTSPEKAVQGTSAYNQGKQGTSLIGCWPKENFVDLKHKQTTALSSKLAFFEYMALVWNLETSNLN